jgi:glycosyltransferase involved in cell wall biosynthesis
MRSTTIGDCLDSVAAQTHAQREHIVMDGASEDSSLVLVRMRLGGVSNRSLRPR